MPREDFFNSNMPADFLKCVADGGKVITQDVGPGEYVHLCKDKSGKWHRGEVRTKKASDKKTK